MTLGIRTVAATLNEKSVDPEIAETALKRGIHLYKKHCNAKQVSKIYDIYSNKPKTKSIAVSHEFIEKSLGVKIESRRILRILNALDILTSYQQQSSNYLCIPPSFRARDITIPEDIVEEITRIYGYHNLPSVLMNGEIPQTNYDSPFKFEAKIKNILCALGASEIYTLSLIAKSQIEGTALKLKNPLGSDTEYLRTSLKNSLIQAIKDNKGQDTKIHLYEIANTYTPKKGSLPSETMLLSGIFAKYDYRDAKGIIESLLHNLHISFSVNRVDLNVFATSKSIEIISNGNSIGIFGVLENSNYIYYEFQIETLRKLYREFPKYTPIPKFPAQIEDITLIFPQKTMIGEVLNYMTSSHELVSKAELKDIYNEAYTFRIWYQSPDQTLENSEIAEIRKQILTNLQKKFGGRTK